MSLQSIRTVTVLGADGTLGPHVLQALVSAGFSVTVLKRASSKSPSSYPATVKEKRVDDRFDVEELTNALQGQDAVVATVAGSHTELQKKLATAAAKAGVKRFIPADFGSCDSQSARAQGLVPLYVQKTRLREFLQELATEHDQFSWTSIVCGHFFDWSLAFLHLYPQTRTADVLDEGEDRWSASTLGQVGKAVVGVLKNTAKPETHNRLLYVQSFCVTQNQVIEACEKATSQKWKVTKINSVEFTKACQEKMKTGDKNAVEEMVWVLGALEAYWEDKPDFANELLGLKDENLEEVIKTMIANR